MRLRMLPVIFKEGIIASLTGGFYFDSSQTHFSNIVHVYVWITLIIVPLVLISTQRQTGAHEDDQEDFLGSSEIDDKCRRIGKAGIELADLRDPTSNHVCSFSDGEILVSNTITNIHMLKDRKICNYESFENNSKTDLAFSDSFTDSITFPVSSFQTEPYTSRLNSDPIEQSPCCSNHHYSLVPDLNMVDEKEQPVGNKKPSSLKSDCVLSSSNDENQSCTKQKVASASLKCTVASASVEVRKTDLGSNYSVRTSRPIYVNAPLKRSFIGISTRKAPVRRQFSEAAVKNANEIQRLCTFYDQTGGIPGSQFDHFTPETDGSVTDVLSVDKFPRPSTSMSGRCLVRSDSVRTEIEQCKRILNQLKWDVSRLPPIPITRFTPSVKDLETLDLNPKIRQTAPLSHTRNRSQLQRHALLMDREHHKRTITYLTAFNRNSIPYSTELSLSETIFFWRQCFGNVNFNGLLRHRKQNVDLIACSDIPLSNLSLRPHRLPRGWRSHSLRYDIAAVNSFTPYPRQFIRRPGTAICLQRQQSSGSTSLAVIDSSSSQFCFPENNTVQSSIKCLLSSTGSDGTVATNLEGQWEKGDPDDIPISIDCHTSKSHSISSDFVQSNMQNQSLHEEVDKYAEKQVEDTRISSLSNVLSSDDVPTINLQTTSCLLNRSNSDKIGDDHYAVDLNQSHVTKTRECNRLTRQAGFRRRLGPSTHSYGQSKGVMSHQNERAANSHDSHLQSKVTKEIKKSNINNNLQTSSDGSKSLPTNSISVDQAVDNLLAHLMGVKSLTDTGLTRQQCLCQLRGDGNTEDSENAEWDILYAVTEAATDNATVINEPTGTTTSTSLTDNHQIAQFESTVSETKNRDDIFQVSTCSGNYDENSWNLQEINIRTRPSTNGSRELDDEIHTREAGASLSNESGSDRVEGNHSSTNSLLWFFRKGFKPLKLPQQQRPTPTAPVHTISLISCFQFTLRFQLNRLELGYIFDKSFTIMEIILCSILAALVSFIGYYMLRTISFQDYGPLACFTIAGCHYSLIKSVQPDPASPKHGFNRVIVFSRSFFFCFFAAVYLLANYFYQPQKSVLQVEKPSVMGHTGELLFESSVLYHQSTGQMLPPDAVSSSSQMNGLTTEKIVWRMPNFFPSKSYKVLESSAVKFYGFHVSVKYLSYLIECSTIYILLMFPILFCLGLMPQINTVFIYALEQLDIHIFGSSGTTSLLSVVFSIFRTFVVIGLTFVPCYYAVEKSDPQCTLFSLFWGLQIALCFLLSRLPSNAILYETLLPSERCLYYWYRIRIYFHNAFYQIFVKSNLILRLHRWSKKKKKKKQKSQLAPIFVDKPNWWRKLPLLFPNLRMKSTNASLKKTADESVEEFLLARVTQIKGNVDVEGCVPVHSHSLPCRIISRDILTQSTSTPIIKYNLPDENSIESVNTLTTSRDYSTRVSTEQNHQTNSSQITQLQFQNDDPLPDLIKASLLARFENDLLSSFVWFTSAFIIHFISTSITTTHFHSSSYCHTLNWISILLGFLLHYPYPWLLFVKPVIKPDFQGRVIRLEAAYFWLCWIERNLFIPAITMCTVTQSFNLIVVKFGSLLSTFIIIVCSMKMLRNGFCCAKQTYINLFFTNLLFSFDFYNFKEAFPINYFFVSLLVNKYIELFRKLHFIYVYLAPFNIIWGSVAHAVVQLGSIPHSVFMFANCIFSTILSAPLEPFMASAIFITSYVRPISFWETNHRTQRIETTNMPISAQLRGISKHQVSGNLDGIFYEHLTRKLQRVISGDLQLGRLGGLSISHGDVFILSTDDLNLLIHIIEVGNGFVTYQLRGLEFIGTLCHASESEALRSDPHKSKRFCCFHSKTIHGMLSFNTTVRLRCMTWQFSYSPYIIEGYEVTDHSAGLTFQLTDLRKVLISRFVHCVIYFVCKLPNLSNRLTQLTPCLDANRFLSPDYFDLDPVFFKVIDDDFDEDISGVTKQRFVQIYSDWITYCLKKQSDNSSVSCGPDSPVVSLCLALSLLGRRCMSGQQSSKPILDQFLHGVHQVFSGDINLAPRDDWVLADLDLLQTVVTPSVRIALKLYQDTFTWSSENCLHREKNVVICPETDPKWRFAVLNDADCLFSFRWVSGRTSMDVYRIVQLTKRRLEFRAIKLNPECVRGLWAGQQREQIYLRNNNEERGSIQSANPVLRNLVNSSCDPPIGYPIYVSPLITSFAGDNKDYVHVSGGELSLVNILLRIRDYWRHFRQLFFCRKGKLNDRNNSTTNLSSVIHNTSQQLQLKTILPSTSCSKPISQLSVSSSSYPSGSHSKWSSKQLDGNRQTTLIALIHHQNDLDNVTSGMVPTPSVFSENRHLDSIYSEHLYKKGQKVQITDTCQILSEHLNKLQWPSKEWYMRSLTYPSCRSSVFTGLEAYRIHRWTPNSPEPSSRSFCHRTIALLAFPEGPPLLDGHYVAIWEDKGLIEVNDIDNNDNMNNNNHDNNANNNDNLLIDCLFTNGNLFPTRQQ
ncbi:Pecanex-like protein 1 [Schistosoma japonicum]|nr:Pecanex-like protein 1 [Schistosoma japonicum]